MSSGRDQRREKFPVGESEMAELIHSKDWSATPLGPLESWPLELRLAVDNGLHNPFPVGIAWGKELLQLYNDAYATLLAEKHPRVLGAPTREIWGEVWEMIEPLLLEVQQSGRAVMQENARFVLLREGGLRESFFTFAYSPLHDREGGIAGVQVTAWETTHVVLSQRRMEWIRRLTAEVMRSESKEEIFDRALKVVGEIEEEILFGLFYLQEEEEEAPRLKKAVGCSIEAVGSERLDAFFEGEKKWGGWRGTKREVVGMEEDGEVFSVPLKIEGSEEEVTELSYLVFGLDPLVKVDETYLSFLTEIVQTMMSSYGIIHARRTRTELMERRRENELLQERAHLLESIDDPFYAMDREWRLIYVNDSARKEAAWPKEDVRGKIFWEVFPDLVDTETECLFQKAALTGESQISEQYYGPTRRVYQARIFPWEKGFSVVFRDVTEERDFEAKLVAAREKAEEMTRLKSALLANMSHEVRTPLTSIIGMATVLSRQVPAELQDQAEHIERAGKRLAQTLDSVLTMAQLESSPARVELRPVDLVAEAREAIHALRRLATGRGIKLELDFQSEPVMVEAHRAYLSSVFNNLVGNAIKFAFPRGKVVVEVATEGEEGILRVRDMGIGIGADFLPHLFDEFRQESTGLSRSHGGVGLGLSITRRMVAAMNGRITVFTTPGTGTIFTVVLGLSDGGRGA